MEAYQQRSAGVEFQAATLCFEELRTFLGSPGALALEHQEAEYEVEHRGREVLRLLYQDHLNLRARLEVLTPVTGEDGVLRAILEEDTHRPLDSVFGEVTSWRVGARARDSDRRFPLDAELNLPRQRQSFGVQQLVATEVAKSSFDEVVKTVADRTGATVSKRQAEQLAAATAQDFLEFYAQRPTAELRAHGTELVVTTTDCKGLVMRHADLREATKRAATKAKHKVRKRLSKGEKRNRKRMATVAACYTIARQVRTPADFIRELQAVQDTNRPPKPKPRNKRVWASVQQEQAEVICELFEEGRRRDPELLQTWVTLLDGSEEQLQRVKQEAAQQGVTPVIILDIIHVLEYLWKAAYCFHAEGTTLAEEWVTDRFRRLLVGRAVDVAAGIRRSATLHNLEPEARKAVDKCADYLLKNKQYMRYSEYLAAGYPIATGVIEGACRHLVKDRMDLTGARWSLEGADAVLRLRALRSSGDFDDYWEYHIRREHFRNHLSRYANGTVRPQKQPVLKLIKT
jgi:hypothetical protein